MPPDHLPGSSVRAATPRRSSRPIRHAVQECSVRNDPGSDSHAQEPLSRSWDAFPPSLYGRLNCTRSSGLGCPRITFPVHTPHAANSDVGPPPIPISKQHPRILSQGHLDAIMMYGRLNCTRSSGLGCPRITFPVHTPHAADSDVGPPPIPISKRRPRILSQGHLQPMMMHSRRNCTRSPGLGCPRITFLDQASEPPRRTRTQRPERPWI